ncbi:hypothetical protein EDD85DRAFT_955299 [Armillaria nabsnona]|nr:hypothetical protein EDD85DRAFT_955299 [Armillaria nabsnona]
MALSMALCSVVHLLDFQEGSEEDDHFEFCLDLLERQYTTRTTDSDRDPCLLGALPSPKWDGMRDSIHSSGMVLSDDYDIDANVECTKNRALPRGAISIERAWLFFALQVVIGIFLAYKVLSPDALRISMYVWPLYVLYPTCKRWMYFTPIPLGLMFNIGATMWTVTYETVYQHQDKVDDVKIGMKSLAILCGRHTIPICSPTIVGFTALMSWAGYLNEQGIAYYVSVALLTFVLLTELIVTDIEKPKQCMKFFLHIRLGISSSLDWLSMLLFTG